MRSGLVARTETPPPPVEAEFGETFAYDHARAGMWLAELPFALPGMVADAMRDRIDAAARDRLGGIAADALRGRIRCFCRWTADYGDPIDWHVNPLNGERWNPAAHWSRALDDERRVGDVKLTWEVARFPQAYHFARAATFGLGARDELAHALGQQIQSFVSNNPYGRGVHWNSGQEIAFRLMAWTFGVGALARLAPGMEPVAAVVARCALAIGCHLEANLDYAREAVYNNHLLSESLGLYLASRLLPVNTRTARWARDGLALLEEQADRQVYEDGAYIQQSHNYHRVAMHDYLWAWVFRAAEGVEPPASWRRAMERSLDFLLAHQNPVDGRLPNYGANDGALPHILSTCDFSDFRPTLQALSIATRGERVYPPGPWDEEAAWLFGPRALDLPLRRLDRKSVSFAATGYHVLRGRDPGAFGAFRCGSLRDRFSQIDMLHLDVWWRGQNVLVDGGSYLYNGPATWHHHFVGTASHNTVQVDGHDQMLHYRRFKTLYWTQARLLDFWDRGDLAYCAGEHYGFRRHAGRAVHRRAVLFAPDDLWIVVDRVAGEGSHDVRLHWLCADFPYTYDTTTARLQLQTPEGTFSVTTLAEGGAPLAGTVVAGQESPPRGWIARYYAERLPTPSLAITTRRNLPVTLVSVLGAGAPEVHVEGDRWTIRAGGREVAVVIRDGLLEPAASP
jgi:asparagine synthase (glutamine-hydrolysing)